MNKNGLLLFVLFAFFCVDNFVVYAQNDSIKKKDEIIHKNKPLQFGNDFLQINYMLLDENAMHSMKPTQFTKNYIHTYLTYDPVKDPKRLMYNTGFFLCATLIEFAVLWSIPEDLSNWDREKIIEEGFVKQWANNYDAGPVWDEDSFFFNWITHPYAGAVYYMNARGSGFKRWESFVYSTLMSTLIWEFGVEAFAEIPSWQDLIITPTLGSLLGEGFFIMKGRIIQNEHKVLNSRILGVTSLFIMDPFNELLDVFGYKTQNKIQTYSTIAPVSYDFSSGKNIWGMQVVVVF